MDERTPGTKIASFEKGVTPGVVWAVTFFAHKVGVVDRGGESLSLPPQMLDSKNEPLRLFLKARSESEEAIPIPIICGGGWWWLWLNRNPGGLSRDWKGE